MMRESSKVRRLGSVVMVEDQGGSVVVSTGLGSIELADTIVSPGAVVAALDDIHAHVSGLQNDISSVTAELLGVDGGQRFITDWNVFFGEWIRFYSEHARGGQAALDYFTGDAVSGMRQRAAQFNSFERRFRAFGHDPTDVGNPDNGNSWLGLPIAAWVGIGAGVVALGFVAWTASSAAKFAPAARALRGRRRR